MLKGYVRPAIGGAARVVDLESPAIEDAIRRGDLVFVHVVKPADVEAGRVSTADVLAGKVVVSDGTELEPDTVKVDSPGAVMKLFEKNAERNRRDDAEREEIHKRNEKETAEGLPHEKFIFAADVGAGSRHLLTVEDFMQSGLIGVVRKDELSAGFPIATADNIRSGKVKVID